MNPFDPYHKWLGIPADQQPFSYYRLLGIAEFESDLDVIETAAERQTLLLRTFQTGPNSELAEGLLNEVSEARICLLTAEDKTRYDQRLQSGSGGLPAGDLAAGAVERVMPRQEKTRPLANEDQMPAQVEPPEPIETPGSSAKERDWTFATAELPDERDGRLFEPEELTANDDDPLAYSADEIARISGDPSPDWRSVRKQQKPFWQEPWVLATAGAGVVVLIVLIVLLNSGGDQSSPGDKPELADKQNGTVTSGQDEDRQAKIAAEKVAADKVAADSEAERLAADKAAADKAAADKVAADREAERLAVAKAAAEKATWIDLFDGRDMDHWASMDGGAAEWTVRNGYVEVAMSKGSVKTKRQFGPDLHLQLEFWVPLMPDKRGQARGNSGIYLLGRHEIQILDSFRIAGEPEKACGALWGVIGPSENRCAAPETWQTLDITYRSPRYDNRGQIRGPGRISVVLNRATVIDDAEFNVISTKAAPYSTPSNRGPIVLQTHVAPVRFRNIRVRELDADVDEPRERISIVREQDAVAVNVDGKLFTRYVFSGSPKPYLWPIVGPTGAETTRAFPMETRAGESRDHPHQRSIWFGHGDVNGIDFWSENATKSAKRNGRQVHHSLQTIENGAKHARLVAKTNWIGPEGKKICEDTREIVFRALDNDMRSIDFAITLRATEGPLDFGDIKDGGFGVRVSDLLRADKGGTLVNARGDRGKDVWGKPADWIDASGRINGRVVGIAVISHPANFRHPPYWHARTYGLLATSPFGSKDFPGSANKGGRRLLKGESLTLKYRVLLHQNGGEEVEANSRDFF